MKSKDYLRNALAGMSKILISTVITLLITPVLLALASLFSNLSMKEFFVFILSSIGTFLKSVMIYPIKLWIITLVAGLIIFFSKLKKSMDKTKIPKFTSVTSGVYCDHKWTWKWEYSTDGWVVSDLSLLCPECDTPMMGRIELISSVSVFICPRCKNEIFDNENDLVPKRIVVLIQDDRSRGRFDHK